MRLLALADVHNEEEVLSRLRSKMISKSFDYLILAGDITTRVSFAEDLVEIVKEGFFVPGNNDTEEVIDVFTKAGWNIHKRRVEIGQGLNIAGFGYSLPTPFNTPGEISEEEFERGLSQLSIDENTILITHSPPKGVLDTIPDVGISLGSISVLNAIKKGQPLLHLCGHVHEVVGKQRVGKTLVVNLPPGTSHMAGFIEIEDKKISVDFGRL